MDLGFSESELVQLRADAEQAMPDTCTILTRTLTDNADGRGSKATWSAGANDSIPCRLSFNGSSAPVMVDSLNAAKIEPAERFRLSLPYGTVVNEFDRIKVGDVVFELVSVITPRSYAVSERLLVKRV